MNYSSCSPAFRSSAFVICRGLGRLLEVISFLAQVARESSQFVADKGVLHSNRDLPGHLH
jgi:hypothetical protein